MIKVKKIYDASEQQVSELLNSGWQYLYSIPHNSNSYSYFTNGNPPSDQELNELLGVANKELRVATERLQVQDSLSTDLNIGNRRLQSQLSEVNAALEIAKKRADDLDAQLVALGEENRRLREALQPPKKRRHWPFS